MKMMLTAAILTLAMAGVALAADAEWAFYGVGHVSVNSLSDGISHQVGLTSNTSRFGLRGTSAVNSDFVAFWQVESKLDMAGDSANTTIGTRNTFVGLKNETAGKFIVGRHDTPFKSLGRQVEMFPDQLGDFRSLTMGWDDRQSEIAAWVSPDWDGFSVFAAYQFDMNDAGADQKMTAFSAMGTYTTEHLMFGAAYQGFSRGYDDSYYGSGPTAKRLAAKYMADRFEVAGLYQTMTADFYDSEDTDFDDRNMSVMGLAGTYHADDQWNLKGAMYVLNVDTDAQDYEPYPGSRSIDESDTRVTMIVVGVERVFSENVLVYAQAASLNSHDGLVDSEEYYYGGVPLGGYDSGFGKEVSGSYDGDWQDPAGFSMGAVISW